VKVNVVLQKVVGTHLKHEANVFTQVNSK